MESTIDNKIPEALPAAVRAWLSQSSQTLIDSLGEELEALILFGSAAGRPHAREFRRQSAGRITPVRFRSHRQGKRRSAGRGGCGRITPYVFARERIVPRRGVFLREV